MEFDVEFEGHSELLHTRLPRKRHQVPAATAVTRAKTGRHNARARQRGQRRGPRALGRRGACGIPHGHAGRDGAKKVYVPMRTCHRREVVAQPPAQAARPVRAADVEMPTRRKRKLTKAADGNGARLGQVQHEYIGA